MYIIISYDTSITSIIALLQTQNRDLNSDNQRLISSLVNLRHTFDFIQGLINSLRNEILGLASISAYITFSMGLQLEYLKLKSNNGGEFTSLSRAYKGEESVSTQEIVKELIKAIEIRQSKLKVVDRLTDVLSNTRLVLKIKQMINITCQTS